MKPLNVYQVLIMLRRRGNMKAVQDGDEGLSDSPKISFRWDVESCSTTSSAYSAFSMASSTRNGQNKIATSALSLPPSESGYTPSTKGSWITTDSECMSLFASIHFYGKLRILAHNIHLINVCILIYSTFFCLINSCGAGTMK